MFFSKTVYLIFTILTVKILLSNAQNMQCNAAHGAHGAAKYQEYIEGLLKLKGRMISHAMKMLLKKEDEEYDNHGKGGGAEEEHFIDLGSHPIATPRTLHAEDFTMPPKENTTCSTTTEREIVTWAPTTLSQYHNVKYGSRGRDREEEAATRKHASDADEATTERCVNEMKSGHGGNEHREENRDEDNTTRKHGLEDEEEATHRHHHKGKHDEENREEEQHTTRKHDSENEETVTERHDNKAKNQHRDEDHDEATTTRKSDSEVEDAKKGHNTTKDEHKSEDREEETKKKSDSEKEEESTQRSHNKTMENSEEEMVTRKEESSTKIISCTCNRGGMETTKGGNGDKDSEARKHGEHETSIERPHSKSKEHSTKNEGDELVKKIALQLFKSHVLHRNETTTENAEEEQTGDKTTENEETEEECSESSEEESECEDESEEGEENETCGPEEEEVSNPPPDKQESATSETRKQQNDTEVEQEKQEHNEKISGPTVETNTFKHHIQLLILKPLGDGYTTCGPDEEEITEPAGPHTTCGPDEEEITEPAGQHTTCGPDEEEITDQAEPHTTCGPDEEEITDPAVKAADHETHTSKPINRYNEGGAIQILYTNATTPTPSAPTERPVDITATNDTSFTTPTSIEAYPTMCFPITEPPGNATLEATTPVSSQNVPPSNDTQAATTTAYQAASNAVTQPPEGAPTQTVQTTVPSVTQSPAGDTQEATTQAQTVSPQEVTTLMKLPNNPPEVTTQSLAGYATMCYPVTEAASATTAKPPILINTQKLRRHLKHRWKAQREFRAPSMRAKLSRVVRELRERESKAVDKSKMLTLVHYTGQPRYQRYYLRGLKDSDSSEGRHKKYESNYYPDEQDEPKYEKRSKNLHYLDYKEVRDEDQSGIFEDAMKVKLPFCPTKPPPPQPMAQKCAGKNHNIQHFRHNPTKKPLSLTPLDQCKKCDDEKNASPYIVPIPHIGTGSNDVCKVPDDADDFRFDTDFGDKNKFDTDKGCNDFGIEQFTKKSQAQISLENFRRQEQADPIQQKLSFMGRLLGRNNNCGSTKEASNVKALPTATPAKEPTESKAKSFFSLQKLFSKWFKSKPNCDRCHQKVKLKDILQHKDSIKRLKGGTTKTKRQKSEQFRNIRHQRRNNEMRRQRHKADFGSKLRRRRTNKRSNNLCKINAKKAARDHFTEHRKQRRHALMRRPRRTSFYEQSNSQMNWRTDDVPDLPQSWNENFESDAYNIF
ncbi:uncharacterized protein LOC115066518 [Bactrocera dorsalis]|uniref:Uncharacterized protein LOC115066518 n=1 Tax=Bactrocera dorsalis TaxID=27457 RepID=A0A8N4L4N3_BACDO|nr:uncharacterized protein LOC115066518 [Bactrocera dorsalis]